MYLAHPALRSRERCRSPRANQGPDKIQRAALQGTAACTCFSMVLDCLVHIRRFLHAGHIPQRLVEGEIKHDDAAGKELRTVILSVKQEVQASLASLMFEPLQVCEGSMLDVWDSKWLVAGRGLVSNASREADGRHRGEESSISKVYRAP